MRITLPTPPANFRQVAEAKLSKTFASTFRYSFFGDGALDDFRITNPHQSWLIPPLDKFNTAWLSNATHAGWRFLVIHPTQRMFSVDLANDGSEPRLNKGPLIDGIVNLLSSESTGLLPEVFELRLLQIPQLFEAFAWIKSSNGNEFLLPLYESSTFTVELLIPDAMVDDLEELRVATLKTDEPRG